MSLMVPPMFITDASRTSAIARHCEALSCDALRAGCAAHADGVLGTAPRLLNATGNASARIGSELLEKVPT